MTYFYTRKVALGRFRYFRKAWGPRAAFHLTRLTQGRDWRERLASAIWLAGQGIPATGAADSMGFKGLRLNK